MSSEQKTRPLSEEEEQTLPLDFNDAYYSFDDNRFHATWFKQELHSTTPTFPWFFTDGNEELAQRHYEAAYPNFKKIEGFDYVLIEGRYKTKKVYWDFDKKRWNYQNHRTVHFSDSESESPSEGEEEPQEERPESDDQAEVSQLLESTTQTVTTLLARVSQPQTPQTVPGALPVTPAQVFQSSLPTPAATVPVLPPALPPVRAPSPTPQRTPVASGSGIPVTKAPPVITVKVPRPPAMAAPANTKLLGAAPEPFDGKPDKAEAFWNHLENYYYLNADAFPTEGKKVSSALTYFKIGTSAGEWAQDQQKKALTQTPVNFGTWIAFRDAFKTHFIPAHSKLEATNAMYMSKMGNRPFNEWYQDWFTYASRSGANEETQMFAFRKALPMALHQKIMGVSPQPTTLADLAEKAREFDRLWRMYSNPAFTRNSGPRNRAMTTEDDHIQANATTASRPQLGGKISKEEKDRRMKEKLCFYCGKPNHTARECRVKKSQLTQGSSNRRPPGNRPRNDFRARATVTQEEQYEEEGQTEEHPAQIAAMYHDPSPGYLIPRPHSAPVPEDF
jgi:hypothetical protein